MSGKDVDLKAIKEVELTNLKNHDLAFLGSYIYASRVNQALPDLKGAAQELPPKFLFFNTQASKEPYQDGFRVMKSKIGKLSHIIAEYVCCGDNIGISEAMRKSMSDRLPENKRKEAVTFQKWLKGRLNEKDLQNAKNFAQSVIKKF
ncbi:MAG: flavodoxin family protein [Candidatus Thorarchaeota archaeon]